MAWNELEIGIEWPGVVGEYKKLSCVDGCDLGDCKPNFSDMDHKRVGLKDTFRF